MFMLVSMPCSVGYDSLLIWLIVMLHPMLISCSCIVIASCYFIMAQHIAFKFNRIKLNLNNCWLSHGATISSWPVQPRLPLWEGPNWVYCRASRRCLQQGKVMRGRYLGWVIRLQCIYNFWLFHAIILPVLDVDGLYYTLLYHFWD